MRFARLAETSERVASTRSRKAKVEALAELLRALEPDEVPVVAAWVTGELRQGRIGLGWATVRDLGEVGAAEEAALEVDDVDRAFDELAAIQGAGSKKARGERLRELFGAATRPEQDFLRKLIVGDLRQGALEGILAEAVAAATDLAPARVRRAAMLGGSLGEVTVAALARGSEGLDAFGIELMRPVQPMLAGTVESAAAALEALGSAVFEHKLDGARIQLHKRGDEVRVFTRQLHEVTAAVPEVVELGRALDAAALVLDGEALALRDDGKPHPFQVTMRRFGRRLDVDALRAELPLVPFFFDVLHADGEDWIDRPLRERLARLAAGVPPEARVAGERIEDAAAGEAFLAGALARGHEGVVVKDLGAPYEAGRRGKRWLKIKPVHTLDLVVLAAEWGSGRRKGKLSNLHLGARDPATGGFVMLGKTFKGMTDEVLVRQTEELLAIATEREGHVVHVRPERVVEIAFDGVQVSRQYPGGVALRFARLVRYRDDKTALEADAIDAVRAMAPEA